MSNHTSANTLLTKNHDVFLLEPGELGCMSLAKHGIKVVEDEPLKERFQRIPPPMMEEVRAHMKEMLEAGAISPSQSPWFNTAMLVSKKDRDMCCMQGPKKILIHCPTYKRPLRVSWGLVISLAWT